MKTQEYHDVRSIAIVGSGIDLWMSAAFLSKTIGMENVRISAIELPDVADTIQSSLPVLKSFNKILNIDERDFIKSCSANINLAASYVDWAYEGQNYYQSYVDNEFSLKGFQLYQYLVKANFIRQGFSYDDFNISSQAAKNGRFAHRLPGKIESSYGYQFNSESFALFYKNCSDMNGVRHISASDIKVDFVRNTIASLQVNGEKLFFDLYVDCSLSSLLIGNLGSKKIALTGLDTRVSIREKCITPMPHISLSSTADGILTKKSDLNDVEISFICEDKNKEKYLDSIADDIKDVSVRKDVGFYRQEFWVGNCIALGDAACNFHGLVSAESWLLHSALQKLINIYPRTPNFDSESKEFNRLALQQCKRISVFYLANIKLSRCNIEIDSEELEHKINLFLARGEIPFYEGETYSADFWRGLFFGAKLFPESSSTLVDIVDDQWLLSELSKIKQHFKRGAQEVPLLSDYLERYIGNYYGRF